MPTPTRYAVIGHPIAHSLSPFIHALFAAQTGETITYEAIDGGGDDGGFERVLADFWAAGGCGANVTLPFKLRALQCADEASAEARAAGAANALRRVDGRVEAHNFDGAGLVRDLAAHGCALAGARVLLLGAGGAARGALLPLALAGAERIVVANRTAQRAQQLVQELAAHLPASVQLAACALGDVPGAFDVVVNATSASLDGAAPAVPAAAFAPQALAYDMVYGKGLTPFLALAQAAGARCADGLGMLVEQAAASFAWWRGVQPDAAAARAQVQQHLAQQGVAVL
ncbi:MAG: shikimate dehydrogenase [Ottowia sp.]|nr:shikimate dehydrogenase [Ottowia sp.]